MGLGATSVGVGALYGTGAFSSVSAGRGVSVNAVKDQNGALLEIQNVDDPDEDPVFRNNTSLNMKVDISSDEFDPSTFGISSSESQTVQINADGDVSDVNIDAFLYEDGTEQELFEDGDKKGKISLQRNFSSNAVFGIDGNILSEGNRGDNSISFEIDTTGDNTATIEEFSVQPNVQDVSFDDDGSQFDGGDLPVTFSSQIAVTITRFIGPGGGPGGTRPSEITIDNEEFVAPDSADVVVTLELAERENVDLGIQATFE